MKISFKIIKIIFIFILASATGFPQDKSIIINLTEAKKAVKEYYRSGQYEADSKKVIDDALMTLAQLDIPKNAAFVFDVDETALSNLEYEVKHDFGYISKDWDEWIKSAQAPANPQVKRFYDSLIAKNINVIFLTGRNIKFYKPTFKNLQQEGYLKFDTLICKPSEYEKFSAELYKSKTREKLSSVYKIIGSIGDQWSDLEGGWTIMKVKIPNYMYSIE